MAASFGVGVQLARLLGPAGYGYYGLALSVVTLAGLPTELALPRLVTREVAKATVSGDPRALFGILHWADVISLKMSALIVGVIWIVGLLLAEKLSPIGWALVLGAPMIPLLTLARLRGGALQGLQFIVRGQIPDILFRPATMAALIFMVYLWRGVVSPAAAMGLNSVSAGAVFVLAHLWLRERLPPRPSEIHRASSGWLASSIPMGLADGMRVIQSELSVLLIGVMARPADVGLYKIASVTSFAGATAVAITNFVAFPVIASLHANGDKSGLQYALSRLAIAQFLGVAALCLPLLLIPQYLLALFFGNNYAAAASTLRILAAGQVASSAFGVNVALLTMTHHERRVTRAMGIGLAANMICLPLLTYFWGRNGAAIAVAGALVTWNVLTWWDGKQLLGLDASVATIARSKQLD